MYTPFNIGFNSQYGPYAHFGYWALVFFSLVYFFSWIKIGNVNSNVYNKQIQVHATFQ